MEKKTSLTSCQLIEIISLIEHQIFDIDFYAKYGYFFDSLISRHVTPEMKYPDEFIRTINGIASLWNTPEKLYQLYEVTSCDQLYTLYVRCKILTVYAHTMKDTIEIPDNTLIGQFKFLFTRFYISNVHLPLAEVHGVSLE
ncbi:MAG: hypothetical protein NC489_43115 [Ruminococcus flavefaciens]|nr:hypothetical protein [Eubacterium sp.]MCM1236914.1 hypothetical protein [Ruminococcus flavefaciens]